MPQADVIFHVVEQHCAEACFGWTMRDAAAKSPAYDLLELCELDDRVECHLDGLRLAGDVGFDLAVAALEEGEEGGGFVAALLSIERRDWNALGRVLEIASEERGPAREVVAALGWTPASELELVWKGLLASDAPAPLERLGVAGHAVHRLDAVTVLSRAVTSDDALTRARAYRAVGELKVDAFRSELADGLAHDDEACRFWAAWAGTLLHDERARSALEQIANTSDGFRLRACDLLVRSLDPARARAFLQALAPRSDEALRAAIIGAGVLGDPALAPWLLSFLGDDERKRPAAWSLALMFNANTEELRGRRPAGFVEGPSDDPNDEDVESDPDGDLPWPDAARFTAWVQERAPQFTEGSRYLLGRPVESGWLKHVLVNGNQVARAGAALELALGRREMRVYEVRAPGYRQLAELGG